MFTLLGFLLVGFFYITGVMHAMTWLDDEFEDENGNVHTISTKEKIVAITLWFVPIWQMWRWGADWLLVFRNLWAMMRSDKHD